MRPGAVDVLSDKMKINYWQNKTNVLQYKQSRYDFGNILWLIDEGEKAYIIGQVIKNSGVVIKWK